MSKEKKYIKLLNKTPIKVNGKVMMCERCKKREATRIFPPNSNKKSKHKHFVCKTCDIILVNGCMLEMAGF